MTIIRNLRWGKPIAIESIGNEPDFQWLRGNEVGINGYAYPRDEVLAALGAVDRVRQEAAEADIKRGHEFVAKARESLAKVREAVAEQEAKLAAVTAERDAHAATIGRVRALAEEWTAREGNSVTASVTRHRGRELLGALEPPKPFVLPTEVPARIEVRAAHGEVDRLILWTDGKNLTWWTEDDGSEYTPEQVMSTFTGHRLLEDAE